MAAYPGCPPRHCKVLRIFGKAHRPLSLQVVHRAGYVSTDGGATYGPAIDTTNGVAFVDNLHGVATGFHERLWYRTTDGGATWLNLGSSDTTETWGIYGVKGTPWFFTAGEGDDRSPTLHTNTCSPRRSSDFGATWNDAGPKFTFRRTGDIEGFGFTLYYQSYAPGTVTGLFRSRDSGATWQSIGGPSNDEDTRFVVLGCRGEVIYAFDNSGGVWKTTDGGDGSMPQFTLEAKSIAVDSIDICRPRDTTIALKDLGCDTVQILNASAPPFPSLSILDPATGFPPKYPITVMPGSQAMLELELSASNIGPYQTAVIFELDREGIISYDTLPITSSLRFYNPVRAITNSVQYDSTALCSSRDTSITIVNDSCFGVFLVNSQLKYGANYMLDTAWTNDSIAAFSDKTFYIRFAPTQAGALHDSLILNLVVLGKSVRMSIPIDGIGKADNPLLVMADRFGDTLRNQIEFGTMTRCQDSIFPFTVEENGCDSLYVSLEWLDSTMTNPPPASEFKWFTPYRRWLTSSMSPVEAGIEIIPTSALGDYTGYLRVTDSIKGTATKVVRTIPYHVNVIPGTRTLSLNDIPRNFDTIAFCESRDTVISISNVGCDTLHISEANLSSSNFIFVPALEVPFIVMPFDSTKVTIRYLPTISGPAFDTLLLVTDADSAQIRKIPLAGFATPTDTIRFRAMTTDLNVKAGDTATVEIMAENNFSNKGLSTITITLAYNSDVMTIFNPSQTSTGVQGAGAPFFGAPLPIGGKIAYQPVTINGTNLTFDSLTPLLTLQFLIALSDSARTSFRIADFKLNNGDMNFNKCALGAVADSASITLDFVCGDSILYNFLRGANWDSASGILPAAGSAHPNPIHSGETLSIPFTALRAAVVDLSITDEAGKLVYSVVQNVSGAGPSLFVIPSLPLPNGGYHYSMKVSGTNRVPVSGNVVVTK